MNISANNSIHPELAAQSKRKDSDDVQGRLSSEARINSARDDAAGGSIADKLNISDRAKSMAQQAEQGGISLVQTADDISAYENGDLPRMRESGKQNFAGAQDLVDREAIQDEVQELPESVTRAISGDEVGKPQEGFGRVTDDATSNSIPPSSQNVVNEDSDSIDSVSNVGIDTRIVDTSSQASIGSFQGSTNRGGRDIDHIARVVDNVSGSRSRIFDVDFDEESAASRRREVLQQQISAFSQGNGNSQAGLSLLA